MQASPFVLLFSKTNFSFKHNRNRKTLELKSIADDVIGLEDDVTGESSPRVDAAVVAVGGKLFLFKVSSSYSCSSLQTLGCVQMGPVLRNHFDFTQLTDAHKLRQILFVHPPFDALK